MSFHAQRDVLLVNSAASNTPQRNSKNDPDGIALRQPLARGRSEFASIYIFRLAFFRRSPLVSASGTIVDQRQLTLKRHIGEKSSS
jgi:hypothetical protein